MGAFWKVNEDVRVGKKEKERVPMLELGKFEAKYFSQVINR